MYKYAKIDLFEEKWRMLVEEKVEVIQSLALLYTGTVNPSTLPIDTFAELLSNLTDSRPLFTNLLEYYPFKC